MSKGRNPTQRSVLIIGLDAETGHAVRALLGDRVRVLEASSVADASMLLSLEGCDAALLDARMSEAAGRLREHGLAFTTASGDRTRGPRLADGSVVASLDHPPPRRDSAPLTTIHSPAMRKIMALATKVARTPSCSALIVGESGVGKELVSSFIHSQSARQRAPHVRVNMAALPASMIEAELFGSVRGAFTDARQDRAGLFASADGGTILLDELCEMHIDQQPKLLRVLEEHRYYPVGSDRERKIDVRVLGATNRCPEEEVAAGRLRADLYYRLSRVIIRVPPLRDRPEDIAPLAAHFLHGFAAELGVPAPVLTAEARTALLRHGWPGNVRELRNVIERAVMCCDDEAIGLEHLMLHGDDDAPDAAELEPDVPGEARVAHPDDWPVELKKALEMFERVHIERAMERAGGKMPRAAQMLGLSRSTLWEKCRRYGAGKP